MRRNFSIFILSLLLVNSVGFYAYYYIQLQKIRDGMRLAMKTLPRHELDVITMSAQAFEEALEEESEIEYNNKMYDIAWTERNGENMVVFCKHDEKEDSLIALLNYVVNSPLKKGNEMPGAIWQFLTLVFILPIPFLTFKVCGTSVKKLTTYYFSTKSFALPIELPPPR